MPDKLMDLANGENSGIRRIGEAWSGIRGLLNTYSTQLIKSILGKASLPMFRMEYTATYKGPVLDEAARTYIARSPLVAAGCPFAGPWC